tara:strand:+ start:1239 stop:1340 length:102 start_codon:yes stop_codon:yes gene_type:complete
MLNYFLPVDARNAFHKGARYIPGLIIALSIRIV